jgi:hypothetical protein
MSLFAIVILSVIGSLFKVRTLSTLYRAYHTLDFYTMERMRTIELTGVQSSSNIVMGSEEDPKDGGAVAGAVFGAVFIYIVRS